MYKKLGAAISLIACAVIPALAGGVTNVKEIINNTSRVLVVSTLDSKNGNPYSGTYSRRIPADGGTWTGDMWIPWATNDREFIDHRMYISVDNGSGGDWPFTPTFAIWQTGEFVRYSKEKYVENAPKVPGESRSGGDRRLVITESGKKLLFKFEKL